MFIQEMTRSDCLSTLASARLGRLACARANQPYVAPIYSVYQEPYLYGFSMPGQKVEWMRSNPLVCVEFDEVGGRDEWTSIVVFGQYEELPDTPEWENERLRAYELLQRHAAWWEPGVCRAQNSPGESLTPVFYRIRIDHITGRRANPDRRSRNLLPRGEGQGWLRRLFHTLSTPLARRRRIQRDA